MFLSQLLAQIFRREHGAVSFILKLSNSDGWDLAISHAMNQVLSTSIKTYDIWKISLYKKFERNIDQFRT